MVALDGVTELRVHGVGGTPPQDMLDDPSPVQVSGDRIAGVMRAHDDVDSTRSRGPSSWWLEAYSWGGLTGRAQSRALWLLVLPFAMVNMAGWMAPTRGQALHRGAVRLVGLCLTALYVLFVAEMTMDFAMNQCAASTGCLTSSWPVVGDGGVASSGARRVVVGAVGPLAVVGFLALLTRVSRSRYEQWRPPWLPADSQGVRYDPSKVDEPTETGLVDAGFWTGQGFAGRLAELHVFSALALVALLVSAGADELTTSVWARPMWVLCAGLLAAAGGLTLATRLGSRLPRRAAPVLGLALVVAAVVVAWVGSDNGRTSRPLPGLLPTFDVVLGAAYAAAFVLLGSGIAIQWRHSHLAPATKLRQAYTPFAVIVVAGLLTTTVFAGTALWLAHRLGTATSVGRGAQARYDIVYPQPFEALARALPVLFLLGIVVGVVMGGLTWRRVGGRSLARLSSTWPSTAPDGARLATGDAAWRRKVGRALRLPAASLAGLEWTVWAWAGLTIVGAVTYGAFWVRGIVSDGNLTDYLDLHDTIDHAWWLLPLGLSTWLLTFVPLAAALVMRRTLTRPSTRRLVAIAWDVSTFFPRAFHPLGPPCYAERAVPELQTRLHRIWSAGGRVVLLGHSQGSVLVAAAVASLPRDSHSLRDRLAVVTYGCPLRRLYGRHFPAYFDEELRRAVADRLGADRWDNFFHDTDLVGHRVLLEGESATIPREHWLPDPATALYLPGDQLPESRGHGHHGYRRQAEFQELVRTHVEALVEVGRPAPS
jgi:hypothetical protein